MEYLNINQLKKDNYPDIYFTKIYGKACQFSDGAKWELCKYKDLIYIYLKKEFIFEGIKYYDLLTPYGYSGYYFENEETLNEFIPLFRIESKKKNYLTEVIRQNPYIDINLTKHYNKILTRKIFAINIEKYNNFDEYLKNTHKDNRRGYKIAIKNKLIFKIEDFNNDNLNEFLKIYNLTMNHLNSTKYYYFNKEYFQTFFECKENVFFANVYHNNLIIASCLIFKFGNYLHYHLGGSYLEYRNLRPNNLIHCKVINYGIKNNYKLYVLGGGLKDNDSLYYFKSKISNCTYDYTIFKNVLNEDIYNKICKNYDKLDYFPIHRK